MSLFDEKPDELHGIVTKPGEKLWMVGCPECGRPPEGNSQFCSELCFEIARERQQGPQLPEGLEWGQWLVTWGAKLIHPRGK